MLSIISEKEKENLKWRIFRRSNTPTGPCSILEQLSVSLDKELKLRLRQLDSSFENPPMTEAIHLATDNLLNIMLAVEQTCQLGDLLTPETALALLDKQSEQTKEILQIITVAGSGHALEIARRTHNLLFSAKLAIKKKFSLITPLVLTEINGRSSQNSGETELKLLPSAVPVSSATLKMKISSTLLYEMHHSLFPAERMLVGAGCRNGQTTEIDGIFDVTGKASSGYVKADSDRLARALIVMSETAKYFALWIHSHPGMGKGATYPSKTDTDQEAEWLKDFSPNLVNAIVVEDRFVRFWGRALTEKRISLEITGPGVRRVSETEDIYQLEF